MQKKDIPEVISTKELIVVLKEAVEVLNNSKKHKSKSLSIGVKKDRVIDIPWLEIQKESCGKKLENFFERRRYL